MTNKLKPFGKKLTLIAKTVLMIALLWWLVDSGKMDLATSGLLMKNPYLLMSAFFLWLFGALFSQTIRWKIIMAGMNIHIPLISALRFSLIGLLFNTVMPGSVGGDLVKAYYVCDEKGKESRAPVILSIVFDRMLGLCGLTILGVVGIALNPSAVILSPSLVSVAFFIFALFFGMFGFFLLISSRNSRVRRVREKLFQAAKLDVLQQLTKALELLEGRKKHIAFALTLAVLFQLGYALFCYFVTYEMTNTSVEPSLLLTILPICVLVAAVPISPGGIGVGHVAFDQFYQLIGISGGSNVFNLVLLSQMVPNLIGAIPYLLSGKKKPKILDEQDFSVGEKA